MLSRPAITTSSSGQPASPVHPNSIDMQALGAFILLIALICILNCSSYSGPWPWNDIGDADIPVNPMLSPYSRITPSDKPWHGYPGCLFPNWKDRMLRKCGIQGAIDRQSSQNCMIYTTNVMENGKFHPGRTWTINNTPSSPQGFWDHIQSTVCRSKHRSTDKTFADLMHSGEQRSTYEHYGFLTCMDAFFKCWGRRASFFTFILCLFNKRTRYNIEPFFFSSSLNWIPCRYQEIEKDKKGDRKLRGSDYRIPPQY